LVLGKFVVFHKWRVGCQRHFRYEVFTPFHEMVNFKFGLPAYSFVRMTFKACSRPALPKVS
jgi:hypothetical protein